jgi:glycerol-3-phosphate dehydrogenase (NAD(P)+)
VIALVGDGALGAALADRLRADGREVGRGVAAAREARLVLVDATPAGLPGLAEELGPVLDGNHLVAHMVRGLFADARHTNGPAEVIAAATAVRRIGVLAGPLRVGDLSAGAPSAAVVASRHPEVVEEFAVALSTPKLRVYRSQDPLGVELGAAVGDFVAIACGMAQGLGYGEATEAVLVVRAVRELGRLIAALGGDPATASGLSGLGDIMLRARDQNSPAWTFGKRAVTDKPEALPAPLGETAKALRQLGRQTRVSNYLFDGLARVVAGEIQPRDIVEHFMKLPVLDD